MLANGYEINALGFFQIKLQVNDGNHNTALNLERSMKRMVLNIMADQMIGSLKLSKIVSIEDIQINDVVYMQLTDSNLSIIKQSYQSAIVQSIDKDKQLLSVKAVCSQKIYNELPYTNIKCSTSIPDASSFLQAFIELKQQLDKMANKPSMIDVFMLKQIFEVLI